MIKKIILTGVILFSVFLIVSCSVSPVVDIDPVSKRSAAGDDSTLLPRIQSVYPGTLQSLDNPLSYPDSVPPAAASISVIFSHVMENASSEMLFSFELIENSGFIDFKLEPDLSSNFFVITPYSGYRENSLYTLRIYKSAFVSGDDSGRHLHFENLVEPPALFLVPVNPDYVEYTFRTGTAINEDSEHPFISYTAPYDGEMNVNRNIPYIEIIFGDNNVPVINPSTVNPGSIILRDVSHGADIYLEIDFIESDADYGTFHAVLPYSLPAGSYFKLTVSRENFISDYSGNLLMETDIYFTTAY